MNELAEKIKSRIDIKTALQRYTSADLTKLGNKRKGNILCPFHAETSPSFLVNTINNTWKCFACNIGGDVISLYATVHGVDNKEAMKLLASELGLIHTGNKLSKQARDKFLKEKSEKEIIKVTKQNIDKTYIELCELYHLIQDYVEAAKNMDELDMIASMCDEEAYIEFLIDSLLGLSGKDEYLEAYVNAVEVIKKWSSVLKI